MGSTVSEMIVSNFHLKFHRLSSLHLRNFSIKIRELTQFLVKHKGTLATLNLHCISFWKVFKDEDFGDQIVSLHPEKADGFAVLDWCFNGIGIEYCTMLNIMSMYMV